MSLTGEGIAITGLSVRYPDAHDQWEFWDNLVNERDSIRKVSNERKKLSESPDWNDFLGEMADVEKFDNDFFGISEEEALFMDVRQRILLETAYDAIEDAGEDTSGVVARKIGVYIANVTSAFVINVVKYARENSIEKVHPGALLGVLANMTASRISHQFNFTGPSISLDTACSGFLSALDRAAEDIKLGKIEAAVVGSVNCMEIRDVHMLAKNAGILTPHKSTRAFDKNADGSVLGEGAAVYYFEKLSKAEKRGKRIYATILGSAVNNDGASLGIMAPSPRGQLNVLEEAYRNSGLAPSDVSYIEAHGTGTVIGDPIEINTLAKLFKPYKKQNPALRVGIGSVKTNIGHLLTAAGSAGLTKILLSMKHKTLPASLHAHTINPALRIEKTPFYLVNKREPWEPDEGKFRVAGVSSFGLGGANAHVVVREYKQRKSKAKKTGFGVLVFSAKEAAALDRMEERIKNFGELRNGFVSLCDVAYTLAHYRSNHSYRRAEVIIGGDLSGIVFDGLWQKHKSGKTALVAIAGEDSIYISQMKELIAESALSACTEKADIAVCINGVSPPDGFTGEIIEVDFCSYGDELEICKLAACLYVKGIDINWEKIYPIDSGNMISLPGYPFEKKTFWLHSDSS